MDLERDPIAPLFVNQCREVLREYHADALSVLAKHGISGASYDDVWLEINARLVQDLDAKGRTDGALSAVADLLEHIEEIQSCLDHGRVEEALLVCLAMVRVSHQLRGRMVLKADSAESGERGTRSGEVRAQAAEVRKQKVRDFSAKRPGQTKYACWSEWEKLYGRKKIGRSTFYKYLE